MKNFKQRAGRALGAAWRGLDLTRRALLNGLFLLLLLALPAALLLGGPERLKERTALVLDLSGAIVEQGRGGTRDAALRQLRGESEDEVRLRDVIAVLEEAARDERIASVVLLPQELSSGGLVSQRELAAAIERFKASGKPVVAWATGYDQRAYYLAAHASEAYLHPMGGVLLQGYGRLRNYYREALDRLGVSANVVRVGRYKNAGEPFFASAPSKETLEAEALVYEALWSQYTEAVEKARRLQPGHIERAIASLPAALEAEGGDAAALSLKLKLVDGLKTRDELRERMVALGERDAGTKSFRQIGWRDYLKRLKPAGQGDAVAVIVAEGEIGDGVAPPGRVGGRSTGDLIRKAREDERIKAMVLRVNSPGGSALGSELVRRELELTRAAGKPVVVSMGDVAASGGYWIAMAADEVMADPATLTGSIGVFAMLPTAPGLMDKLSVRTGGHGTTWLSNGYDPRRALDPRFEAMVRASITHIYEDFTAKAAAARKTTPQAVDAVAQGRVWTGAQALERGLIDRMGSWSQALQAARDRARLPPDAPLKWMEREPGRVQQLLQWFSASALQALIPELRDGAAAASAVSTAMGASAAAQLLQAGVVGDDLQWLMQILQQRRPFAAVVHCLCSAPD